MSPVERPVITEEPKKLLDPVVEATPQPAVIENVKPPEAVLPEPTVPTEPQATVATAVAKPEPVSAPEPPPAPAPVPATGGDAGRRSRPTPAPALSPKLHRVRLSKSHRHPHRPGCRSRADARSRRGRGSAGGGRTRGERGTARGRTGPRGGGSAEPAQLPAARCGCSRGSSCRTGREGTGSRARRGSDLRPCGTGSCPGQGERGCRESAGRGVARAPGIASGCSAGGRGRATIGLTARGGRAASSPGDSQHRPTASGRRATVSDDFGRSPSRSDTPAR